MAKRRRTVTRSHTGSATTYRPGFSRGAGAPAGPSGRRSMAPPSARQNNTLWWVGGAVVVVLVLGGLVYLYGFGNNGSPAASAAPSQVAVVAKSFDASLLSPPDATPLASPLAAPAGDGTTATIDTDLGTITFNVFNQSAPVASENFINLADAHFYDGVVFHRLVPGFMIQGGDPSGNGTGGPGYTIADEPIVGSYTRGMVAMARTSAPHSEGSQFFILVKDSPFLAGGGYTIFGQVTSGMDVVDQIVSMPTANDDPGGTGGTALDPVVMNSVTITPGSGNPMPSASGAQPSASGAAPSGTSPQPSQTVSPSDL
jgi:cyclophilin family peptidyl-prolyl cis-trans isomerase